MPRQTGGVGLTNRLRRSFLESKQEVDPNCSPKRKLTLPVSVTSNENGVNNVRHKNRIIHDASPRNPRSLSPLLDGRAGEKRQGTGNFEPGDENGRSNVGDRHELTRRAFEVVWSHHEG